MKKITLLLLVFLAVTFSWQANAQCDPSTTTSTDTTTFIDDVTTTNGAVNISNLASGLSAGRYQNNFATMSVSSFPGGIFDFSVVIQGGTVGCAVWVDWNGDLTFDPVTETVYNTTSYGNGPFTGSITVPGGTADGDYYMRVMIDWNDSNPDDDACVLSSGRGEVEDYKVTVDSALAPSCNQPSALTAMGTSLTEATLGWTAGGGEANWTVEYGAIGFVQGSGTSSMVTANSLNLSALTAGNQYDFYVQANCGGTDGDSAWSGPTTWTQPSLGESCAAPIMLAVELDCGTATPHVLDYATAADLGTTDLSCDTFGTNTGQWFEFTAPVSGGVVINTSDSNEILIVDACGGTDVVCNSTASTSHDVSGLTGGNTYYLAVWKDSATTGTSNICIEEVSCPAPTAGSGSFTTATTANLSWTAGGSETAWDVEILVSGGTATGTPTATGVTNPYTAMTLTEGNSYDFYVRADCGGSVSDWAGPFSWDQISPPANDECSAAIGLTVNPDYGCGAVTSGTTVGATASAEDTTGTSGTPNTDVWYSFTATATDHRIELQNVVNQGGGTSTSTDMGMTLYDATTGCASLVFVGTSDPNTYNVTGLTIGVNYYVRVYGWGTTVQNNNFDICVGTAPACSEPTGLSATPTTTTADISWTAPAIGATPVGYNWEIQPVGIAQGTAGAIIGNVATTMDTAAGLTESTGYDLFVQSDCGGGDLSTWAGPFSFGTLAPPPACGGNYYDSGGVAGSYSPSESTTVTISPDVAGDGVYVTFTYVDIETNAGAGTCPWDFLTVYDGPDATAPVLFATLCGEESGDGDVPSPANTLSVGQSIGASAANTSGALTFVFTSDSSVQETGWEATVACYLLNTPDENFEGFKYYPNPVRETLSLRAQNNIENVAIYNIVGQEVMKLSPNAMSKVVDMSSLSQGAYFVKVSINGATESFKIIKE